MFASKHPFRDTLVIEIDRESVLDLHGALVRIGGNETDYLLSILEAFHAGTDMSRFEREDNRHNDPADDQLAANFVNHISKARQFRHHGEEISAALKADQIVESARRLSKVCASCGWEGLTEDGTRCGACGKTMDGFRDHGEEITDAMKTRSQINRRIL